jgi:hypothetical protein
MLVIALTNENKHTVLIDGNAIAQVVRQQGGAEILLSSGDRIAAKNHCIVERLLDKNKRKK